VPRVGITHGPNFRALRKARAKSIVTVHDVAFLHFPNDYPAEVVRELSGFLAEQARTVDLVICDSAATEADLVAADERYSGRTAVVHLGVDSDWFEPPDRDAVGQTLGRLGIGSPYLLHLGALVPRKDLGTLVRAWLLLRTEHPDLGLVLAGPHALGWKSDQNKLQELVRGCPAAGEQLRLPGYVDDATGRHLLSAARAYVSTSKLEGFGLPVLEAMAAGIPVVSTQIPGVEEVAGPAVTYAPVGDSEAVANAVLTVLARPDSSRLKAAQARAQEFSWRRCAEQTLNCYRSL
jgi:glycosyltransferase involved in cell wall biosynthesis